MASKSMPSFLLVLCIMASCLLLESEAGFWHFVGDYFFGIDRPCLVQAECDVMWCLIPQAPACILPLMADNYGKCHCAGWPRDGN